MENKVIGIGGLGGSGTRWLFEWLSGQEIVAPGPRNESEDFLDFTRLFKWQGLMDQPTEVDRRWTLFKRLIRGQFLLLHYPELYRWFTTQPFEPSPPKSTVRHFRERLRGGVKGPWLFKEPNLQLFAPELVREDPLFYYVHLIRDGRDMAFNRNQQQLENFGPAVLTPEQQLLPRPDQTVAFWHWANTRIAHLAEHFPERVFVVRYEALLDDPEAALRPVVAGLGLKFRPVEAPRKKSTTPKDGTLQEVSLRLLHQWGY